MFLTANIGSRSAYVDLTRDDGRALAETLLGDADIVVNNHRGSKLERLGLDPRELAERRPGLISVSVTCYGSDGPWADRGGFDMNGSAASGLMALEGTPEAPRLPVTGMINDFIAGYMGALGATAALVKQVAEGGSWHVTVNLTRTAMCGTRPSAWSTPPTPAVTWSTACASRPRTTRRLRSVTRTPSPRRSGSPPRRHAAALARSDPRAARIESAGVAES